MSTYQIAEVLMSELRSKLATVQKRCAKYGCNFSYAEIGEEYREIENPETHDLVRFKFITVEVSGTVLAESGWRYIATVDSIVDQDTQESKNIIRQYDFTVTVPDRYQTTACRCEHCNSVRRRNHTHILYNEAKDEFKQVGSSCLKDFTGSMTAEHVASVLSWYDLFAQAADVDEWEEEFKHRAFDSVSNQYFQIKPILLWAIACVDKYGYTSYDNAYGPLTVTGERAFHYYLQDVGKSEKRDSQQIVVDRKATLQPEDPKRIAERDAMIEWAVNMDIDDEDSFASYYKKLKQVVASEYIRDGEANLLASLVPTYRNYLKRQAAAAVRAEADAKRKLSQFVGNIGDRIDVEIESGRLVTTFDTMYGVTYLFEFVDTCGNILKWFASCDCAYEGKTHLKGTVKAHEVYQGNNETVLTRCKVY